MPHVVIHASAVALPLGSDELEPAPDADWWPHLLAGTKQLRVRPRLGVNSPVCALGDAHPGCRAAMLACNAVEGLGATLPARAALLIATAKGEMEPWLNEQPKADPAVWADGLAALPALMGDVLGELPAPRIISNACVSGAQALMEGAEMLLDGDTDAALVVGADALSPFIAQGFRALQADSPTGARPFDAERDGLSLGEAGAAALLTRDGDGPRLIGWGASNDANHISGPSRDGSGLALAIERALAGIDRSRVVAICAHGTGTRYNDAMEARAFHKAFAGKPPPVFAIKGAIGHSMGAAGLIEAIVSARVAAEGIAPPTVGFTRGDDEYPLDVIHGSARDVGKGLVLSTNSGFGGMNTALVIGGPA
jgi:3-oxoacyl-(acyl-carrier-protein) synthase